MIPVSGHRWLKLPPVAVRLTHSFPPSLLWSASQSNREVHPKSIRRVQTASTRAWIWPFPTPIDSCRRYFLPLPMPATHDWHTASSIHPGASRLQGQNKPGDHRTITPIGILFFPTRKVHLAQLALGFPIPMPNPGLLWSSLHGLSGAKLGALTNICALVP